MQAFVYRVCSRGHDRSAAVARCRLGHRRGHGLPLSFYILLDWGIAIRLLVLTSRNDKLDWMDAIPICRRSNVRQRESGTAAHRASSMLQIRARMGEMVVANLVDRFAGRIPQGSVTD